MRHSVYKRFTGLDQAPDEYQKGKIDETLALMCIIGMIGLLALTLLSWRIDFESEQLSVFSVGAPILLCVIGARSITLSRDYSSHKFYVETEEAARQLRRKLTRKYAAWMLLFYVYFILVINVLAPLLSGKGIYWYWSETLNMLIIFIPCIFLVSVRKQVQVRKDDNDGD
ncbi:Uncharacterised protein [Staphylococcus microti]|uniref:DUF3278 domain-containing protein n=1 Tax=Staphylococcus microti TaxID=569857 RepID=A0A380GW05_9STAP|nr:hypothetical protein [Staphylococcus microti]PNZ75759.1 hypothetical protein CD132_11980 [Staphylococcus microti]SUM58269.1 Uncharacterised protein [Staphylococcus microti]